MFSSVIAMADCPTARTASGVQKYFSDHLLQMFPIQRRHGFLLHHKRGLS